MSSSRDAHVSLGARVAAVVAVCLAIGVMALTGSVFAPQVPETDKGSPAAAEPTVEPSDGLENLSEAAELEAGEAAADDEAADATTAIEPAGDRTTVGAVEAFVSYATWVIASPAAAEDPLNSSEALGGELNSADAAMVEAIDHTSDLDYEPSRGAYRLLGHSGDESSPDQVMLEVVAPMTVDGQIKWIMVGGVAVWKDGQWLPTSMQPGEVAQPTDPTLALLDLPETERNQLLEGLGWVLFANSDTDG